MKNQINVNDESKGAAKRRSLRELTLMDRFLFDEVLEDPDAYQAVLEIILEREILLKDNTQSEKELRTLPAFRGIRLDVWGQDTDEAIYNSEVQQKNTRNLPHRMRFYQAVMDAGLLEPGCVDFNQLNDVYLIMIAPFDLFGLGRCRYTFRMKCDEVPDLSLGDGAVRMFLNTRGLQQEGVSRELLELLDYMEHTNSVPLSTLSSPRLKQIGQRVEEVKSNEVSEVKYMQLWEEKIMDRMEAKEEGRNEGIVLTKKALKLYSQGLPPAGIAKTLGISVNEVKKIVEE